MPNAADIDIEDIGVADGESWGEAAERLRDRDDDRWHYCICGARYRSRGPALRCCSDRFAEIVTDGGIRRRGSQRDPVWMAAGGEGFPFCDETDKEGRVWLFSCCSCGKRWANPPAPVSGCGCGSDQIVCHRFDYEDYRSIKTNGEPRGASS